MSFSKNPHLRFWTPDTRQSAPKQGVLKHLEEDPPALVEPSDDYSPDWHRACSIMREPEPEPLRLVAPTSLTHRNYEIINVNCFRTLKKYSSMSTIWGLVGWNKDERWRRMGELKLNNGSGVDHTWSYRSLPWIFYEPLITIPCFYALPYTTGSRSLTTTFIESPLNKGPCYHWDSCIWNQEGKRKTMPFLLWQCLILDSGISLQIIT